MSERLTFSEQIARAAADMMVALRNPRAGSEDVYLYSRPTTTEQQGALIVSWALLPAPHVFLRPPRPWRIIPFSRIAETIREVSKREPIL
jgi:hypothetical protein